MKKIGIIGGGAAGLMASIYAASSENVVTILERNEQCGKKILVTGNGRCNYWNENQDMCHYHSSSTKVTDIIEESNLNEVYNFFEKIGIVSKVKNGYYYPFSNQARSIRDALVVEALLRGVFIFNGVLVNGIDRAANGFHVLTDKNDFYFDEVIITTGSKAMSKTGSTGAGYQFAKQLGHMIVPVLPSLVQIRIKGEYLKQWTGIRVEAHLSLFENGNLIREETGELQLTEYGISGICSFNLSRYIASGLSLAKQYKVLICFLPFLKEHTSRGFFEWMRTKEYVLSSRTIGQFLEEVLPYKLVNVLLKQARLDCNLHWNFMTDKQRDKLVRVLLFFEVEPSGVNSYERAQVCSGGVSLDEIYSSTMESTIVSKLYFAGEVLDVDGDCGGYNLSFAWISGMLAGKAVRSLDDSN